MTAIPHFESPKELIKRAREHIDELHAVITTFFGRNPCAKVIDIDPNTGQQIHKIRLTEKLPGRLSAVAKDAASNLRDALDHAVFASAVSLGGGNPEKTAFPFANDATHLVGELASWKLADVPADIKTFLSTFKPYPAGNGLLCCLNKLRNPNTHRILVPVGFASMGTSIGVASGTVTSNSQIGYSRWDSATNEVEFMRLGQGSNMNYNVHVSFEVTFGDIDAVRDQAVVGTLRTIATEVERVVLGIEAETNRLLANRI